MYIHSVFTQTAYVLERRNQSGLSGNIEQRLWWYHFQETQKPTVVPHREGCYEDPVVLGALAQALWARQHPWLFLQFCSGELEQTSSITGSIPTLREQGLSVFLQWGTGWRRSEHVFPKTQICFVTSKESSAFKVKVVMWAFFGFQRNGLSSALGHQDKSFQQGRAQALSNFNC